VPVAPCGTPRPADLKGVPIWAFHGRNDVICPYHASEHIVARLRALGQNESDARLTLYEHAPAPKGWPDYDGHGSPMPAYATAELWPWLLQKKLEFVVA
jgi:predicted peptidase